MAADVSAKYTNIARPYARAAFEYAKDSKQLAEWKAFLDYVSYLAAQPDVRKLLMQPELLPSKVYELFHELLATGINSAQANFLRLLANHRRLLLIAEIAALYQTYYQTLEKSSQIRVVTAAKLEADFQDKLTQALAKRLQQAVTLQCDIDPRIIGGAVIHIGDRVIDGSIRGKLTRLLEFSLR